MLASFNYHMLHFCLNWFLNICKLSKYIRIIVLKEVLNDGGYQDKIVYSCIIRYLHEYFFALASLFIIDIFNQ